MIKQNRSKLKLDRVGGFKTILVAGAVLALMTGTSMAASKVLIAGGVDGSGNYLTSAELYGIFSGSFSSTGSMHSPHLYGSITVLNDGTVLVAGGDDKSGSTTAAEIYQPSTGEWSTVGPLNVSRDMDTAVLLSSPNPKINGQVLVCGGTTYVAKTGSETYLKSCEVYNPTTQGFTLVTKKMKEARAGLTGNLLGDGTVLLAGGNETGNHGTAEIFTPASSGPVAGSFEHTNGHMKDYREFATGTNLNGLFDPHDGQVLIAGGDNGGVTGPLAVLATAERYNPTTGHFTATSGNMNSAREYDTANELPALLYPDEVLIAGGVDNTSNSVITADLYSSSSDTFSLTAGDLSSGGLDSQAAVTLPFGLFAIRQNVLIAGGENLSDGGTVSDPVDTSLIYNHISTDFSPSGNMSTVRNAPLGALVN